MELKDCAKAALRGNACAQGPTVHQASMAMAAACFVGQLTDTELDQLQDAINLAVECKAQGIPYTLTITTLTHER